MSRLFANISKKKTDYNLWRLVDHRFIEDFSQSTGYEQIICDIDKTYLETEFESIVKMARIAFEDAKDKVTVEGAFELILALRWGFMDAPISEQEAHTYPRLLHFVSSSPPQLRKVLEEKLALDGLDWTSDTFKNQVYNLKMRRFDLLKQQVAYKTAAILNLMHKHQSSANFVMIGDNAESDAYIYLGIKLFVEKRISLEALKKYLSFAHVESKSLQCIQKEFADIPHNTIKALLIRSLENYELPLMPPLTDPIILFQDYFEASLFLYKFDILDKRCLHSIFRSFHNKYSYPLESLIEKIYQFFSEKELSSDSNLLEIIHIAEKYAKIPKDTSSVFPNYIQRLDDFDQLKEEEILSLSQKWFDVLSQRHE